MFNVEQSYQNSGGLESSKVLLLFGGWEPLVGLPRGKNEDRGNSLQPSRKKRRRDTAILPGDTFPFLFDYKIRQAICESNKDKMEA